MDELKIGDKVYYHGLGFGAETFVFNIYTNEKGVRIVNANNGVKRNYDEVIANTGALCTSKEVINKRLIDLGTNRTLI